jgi:DNA polymerase V
MHAAIHSLPPGRTVPGGLAPRAAHGLLSLTYPNKELFRRQCALLRGAVPAGFTSPADDYVEQRISLDEHLIRHPESTFFMRVAGDSMRGPGFSTAICWW